MNNSNNFVEIDKINSQLRRAEICKSKLISKIYIEYELYLKLVRDLLYASVEKGLNELFRNPLNNGELLNSKELYGLFKKNISRLIFTYFPLLTVEQLKINEIQKKIKNNVEFNMLGSSTKIKYDQKEIFQNKDDFECEETNHFQISEDISNTSEYYQTENYDKFISLDLDNGHNNYLINNNNIENIGVEKQFVSSIIELIEEFKVENPRYSGKDNINQMEISSNNQSLKVFDLIDKSLENLLLNLSYEINQELFKANLIKKIISKDSFEYLVGKKLMIKHPCPFVINFELNINQSSTNSPTLPSITFFYLSIVELEFKNLHLSIQRNKINELRNQFQRLIKKETYWRQKEITLNKIR